jgi:hypothetical protein
MIKVLPLWHNEITPLRESGYTIINVTSGALDPFAKSFSPFLLGPVKLYNGYSAKNVENAWQFSKVYKQHDNNGSPSDTYFEWAQKGWNDTYAHRYPMGKGIKPEYSWWNGIKMSYVEARKKVYTPIYAKAVLNSENWTELLKRYTDNNKIVLLDYDAYDHRAEQLDWQDVLNNDKKKCGHAFILAIMLEEGIDKLKKYCI